MIAFWASLAISAMLVYAWLHLVDRFPGSQPVNAADHFPKHKEN